MIHVDRTLVPPPASFVLNGAQEDARAREFYARPLKKRRQERFQFRASRHPDVRAALVELFHGKCAYCESRITASGIADIEHYRPFAGVVRPDGELEPDPYWWLANDWDNLLLSCAACNRTMRHGDVVAGKGARFPLADESTRAKTPEHPLEAEEPLLLDPCRDEPAEHLVFLDDGRVVSDTRRGQETIELLGLNRPGLVDARAAVVTQLTLEFRTVRALGAAGGGERFRSALGALDEHGLPEKEYAGLKRQLVARWLATLTSPGDEPAADHEIERVQASHEAFVARLGDFSVDEEADDETLRRVTRRIERIVLHDVKAIEHVELVLGGRARTAPWTVLLGENGSGKSTILQAVAIALAGKDEVDRLGLDAARFIRSGAERGSVQVDVSGSPRPHRVDFTPDGFEFVDAARPQTLLLGYGETRLLPGEGLLAAAGMARRRVEGLFRPARALVDAESWLLAQSDERFDYVARELRGLLDVQDVRWMSRSDGRVWVHEARRRLRLAELSTGYQSVVATVIDVLELTMQVYPSPDTAEGIVLLDEIGAHLHPRWRMRIVSRLRAMLPGVQFLVTTHEPLCLRGVAEGEVVLMQREDGAAYARTELPSPEGLRVDQLLTSPYFGLNTTLDPDLEELFDEYYDLLSRADGELSPDLEARREELATRLQGEGVLGYTRRDQLVYEAIDRFLADERKAPKPAPSDERERVLARVGELWGYAKGLEGGGP